MSELNPKRKAFCREYVKDFNGTQSAIRAGYSKKTAESQAVQLLGILKVQEEVARLTRKACDKAEVTVDRVLNELATIAFLDPNDLLNDDGSLIAINEMPEHARRAIGGLEISTRWEGATGEKNRVDIAKIKITDKGAALERLGKYLKMFVDRVDHTTGGEKIVAPFGFVDVGEVKEDD